ncbi:hypothetical protein HK104_005226, partial [Borealophlyctis nickersoniae]
MSPLSSAPSSPPSPLSPVASDLTDAQSSGGPASLVASSPENDAVDASNVKKTTFRGRLGYACLNTILRAQDPPIFCSRTCRIATLVEKGIQHAHALGLQNAKDIIPMIEWNERHGIRFMRLSSEMFPFASHESWGYKLEDVEGVSEVLKEAGDLAKRLGHRLTMHPGQYTQLGSPNPGVVTRAISDLVYHASILDQMGLSADSVMIIHGGGVYGDKQAALARFEDNWNKLVPECVKRRVVLENDEICYSVE